MYEIPLNKEMKIAAVMKAAGYKYSDTIWSETWMIERAGEMVTYEDLIQAMTQSFRIFMNQSKADSDSDKDETAFSLLLWFSKGNTSVE